MNNILKPFVFLCTSILIFSSCQKVNTKRIKIEDKITNKALTKPTEIKLSGVDNSEYVLFGGDYFTYKNEHNPSMTRNSYSVPNPFPALTENTNSIFLKPLQEYNNEFYVLRRVLKKEIVCEVEKNDEQRKVTLTAGKSVTFVWSSNAGATGWYQYFVDNNAIEPVKVNDTMFIMRVSTNTTKLQVTETDNVKGMTQTIRTDDKGIPMIVPGLEPKPQPLVFEPKQRIGVCNAFKFPGENYMKYVSFKTTLSVDNEEMEYILNSNL